jgi:xanthine/uracil/vitamin C permease (AzgA family)
MLQWSVEYFRTCLAESADITSLDVKLDLITATAAVGAFSSIFFGFLTNLPVALA